MSALIQRELSPWRSDHRAMLEAGGLWKPASWKVAQADVVREARERGIRALELPEIDDAVVSELPGLEFLWVVESVAEARLLQELRQLRFLSAVWRGRLDLARLPRLEWFGVSEAERDSFDSLAGGHPALHHLTTGGYKATDLKGLERLRLTRLALMAPRRLTSLAGIEGLAETLRSLDLWMAPALRSLEGIEALEGLEALELGAIRCVTSLDFVQQLPSLRVLNVTDLKGLESLAPLAGHPALEFVWVPRTRDLDLEPLRAIPNLKATWVAPGHWNVDRASLPGGGSGLGPTHPLHGEYQALFEQ